MKDGWMDGRDFSDEIMTFTLHKKEISSTLSIKGIKNKEHRLILIATLFYVSCRPSDIELDSTLFIWLIMPPQ